MMTGLLFQNASERCLFRVARAKALLCQGFHMTCVYCVARSLSTFTSFPKHTHMSRPEQACLAIQASLHISGASSINCKARCHSAPQFSSSRIFTFLSQRSPLFKKTLKAPEFRRIFPRRYHVVPLFGAGTGGGSSLDQIFLSALAFALALGRETSSVSACLFVEALALAPDFPFAQAALLQLLPVWPLPLHPARPPWLS